ncbi:hypothetical protein AB0L13_40225 [Saccharopolyspora shandongensis]|uniref:hypothetical protein n=1 Tax=Saccharopolyspora shandongensis TaxID=418495 RepID=UPI00343E1277
MGVIDIPDDPFWGPIYESMMYVATGQRLSQVDSIAMYSLQDGMYSHVNSYVESVNNVGNLSAGVFGNIQGQTADAFADSIKGLTDPVAQQASNAQYMAYQAGQYGLNGEESEYEGLIVLTFFAAEIFAAAAAVFTAGAIPELILAGRQAFTQVVEKSATRADMIANSLRLAWDSLNSSKGKWWLAREVVQEGAQETFESGAPQAVTSMNHHRQGGADSTSLIAAAIAGMAAAMLASAMHGAANQAKWARDFIKTPGGAGILDYFSEAPIDVAMALILAAGHGMDPFGTFISSFLMGSTSKYVDNWSHEQRHKAQDRHGGGGQVRQPNGPSTTGPVLEEIPGGGRQPESGNEILSDQEKRAEHDTYGGSGPRPYSPPETAPRNSPGEVRTPTPVGGRQTIPRPATHSPVMESPEPKMPDGQPVSTPESHSPVVHSSTADIQPNVPAPQANHDTAMDKSGPPPSANGPVQAPKSDGVSPQTTGLGRELPGFETTPTRQTGSTPLDQDLPIGDRGTETQQPSIGQRTSVEPPSPQSPSHDSMPVDSPAVDTTTGRHAAGTEHDDQSAEESSENQQQDPGKLGQSVGLPGQTTAQPNTTAGTHDPGTSSTTPGVTAGTPRRDSGFEPGIATEQRVEDKFVDDGYASESDVYEPPMSETSTGNQPLTERDAPSTVFSGSDQGTGSTTPGKAGTSESGGEPLLWVAPEQPVAPMNDSFDDDEGYWSGDESGPDVAVKSPLDAPVESGSLDLSEFEHWQGPLPQVVSLESFPNEVAAEAFMRREFPESKEVNRAPVGNADPALADDVPGRRINCGVATVQEFRSRKHGRLFRAGPSSGGMTLREMQDYFGARFTEQKHGTATLDRTILDTWEPGGKGVVYFRSPNGKGHFLYAEKNDAGRATYVDSQNQEGLPASLSRYRGDRVFLLSAPPGHSAGPLGSALASAGGTGPARDAAGIDESWTGGAGTDGPANPGRTVPVRSAFVDPDVRVRVRDKRTGTELKVRMGDLKYQWMKGTGHGVSFRRESKYDLSGDYLRTIKTMPREAPAEAAQHPKRPGNTTEQTSDTLHVDIDHDVKNYVMSLQNGRQVDVDDKGLGAILMNLRGVQDRMADDPGLKIRLLTSDNVDLQSTAKRLTKAGFTGTVEGTHGKVSQLQDGRFGVAGNKGWIQYRNGEKRRVGKYSPENIANIRFFERFLPDASYILDADELLVGRRASDGKEFTFYAHEVVASELTSTSTGWERVNGVTLSPPGERQHDEELAGELDGMRFVARTRLNEDNVGVFVRSDGTLNDLYSSDPLKRLAPSPFVPATTTLTHPDTGAQVQAKVGPNIFTGHGQKDTAELLISRDGEYIELEVSGSTLTKVQFQREEFHRMHAANPNGRMLFMFCHAAEGTVAGFANRQPEEAATLLRDSVATARELGFKNIYDAGRDVVFANNPVTVSNNAGWASSFLARDGRDFIKVHTRTQYSAAELGSLPEYTPLPNTGSAPDLSLYRRGQANSSRIVPVPADFVEPDIKVRVWEGDRQTTIGMTDLAYAMMRGKGLGVSFTRANKFDLSGDYLRTIKTMPGETPTEAAKHPNRPGNTTEQTEDLFDIDIDMDGSKRMYLMPLSDGRDVRIGSDGLTEILMNFGEFRYLSLVAPDVKVRFLTSRNTQLKATVQQLADAGFLGSVEGTEGEVSQLRDGRFGVSDNQGWIEYTNRWISQVNNKYSPGNVANIEFFKRFLPKASHILDADRPLTGIDQATGAKVTFYAHEVAAIELTSDSTGWLRVNGLALEPGQQLFDQLFAEAIDSMGSVGRTGPAEDGVTVFRQEDVSHRDPLKRLAPSPFAPVTTTLTHPDTGAKVRVKVGPNIFTGHGNKKTAALHLKRGNKLSVSGETLTKVLFQREEFRRMHAANPNGRLLFLFCRAAEGTETGFANRQPEKAATLLRDFLATAHELGFENVAYAGRHDVATTSPVTTSNNAGWVSGYLKGGRAYIEVHEETRYSAKELEKNPKLQPR